MRGKTWLLRATIVAIAVLVSFAIVEGLLRASELIVSGSLAHHTFDSICEFVPSRHHRLVPNGRYLHSSYEFAYVWANNSLGMRDRERPLHKLPGTFRILVLGDSFVQGHGVRLEDAMVTRLEASLNQPKRGQGIEVLNGGVFGYSPLLEYLYLREIIDPIDPDLVIVAFFLGNDVGEDYFYTQKARVSSDGDAFSFDDREWPWSPILEVLEHGGAPRPVPVAVVHAPDAREDRGFWPRVKGVLRESRAATLVKQRIEALTYPSQREREFALVRGHRGDIRYDLGLVNYPVLSKSERLAYWDISKSYLKKIATLCREHGTRMVLVVIPPVERLNGETSFDEPYEILDELGRELSVPVVQFLGDFVDQPRDTLYYKFDRHWTAEGHRHAAEVLDRALRPLNVLPAEG